MRHHVPSSFSSRLCLETIYSSSIGCTPRIRGHSSFILGISPPTSTTTVRVLIVFLLLIAPVTFLRRLFLCTQPLNYLLFLASQNISLVHLAFGFSNFVVELCRAVGFMPTCR